MYHIATITVRCIVQPQLTAKTKLPTFQHLEFSHGQCGHVTVAIPGTSFRQRSSSEHYW